MKLSLPISILFLLMVSCKTYYEESFDAHKAISEYQFQEALEDIASNRYLKKKRNALLYHLELGRLYHLNGDYEESNKHLNYADDLMDYISTISDLAVSVAVNSASKKYRAEDFEKILLHYYKALNYIYLNNMEDALVEARRMSLKQMELGEKKMKQYHVDPFGLMLIGQIYEKAKEYNNAFISYRNAYEAYLENSEKIGVEMPLQIKVDLMRAAYLSKFYDELDYYEKEFKTKYQHKPNENGELILFWENGKAPHKVEKNYVFTLVGGQGGFYFVDQSGTMQIPFSASPATAGNLAGLTGFRIALPAYEETPMYYKPLPNSLEVNGQKLPNFLEPVENINVIAKQTLKERFVKDLSTHLTKLALNQLAAQALKTDTSSGDFGAILGIAIEAGAFLSERADTRNWQTLPAMISYARVPLTKKDTNEVTMLLKTIVGNTEKIKISVTSKGKNTLQFRNIFTPDKMPSAVEGLPKLSDSLTIKKIKP